MEFEGEVWIEIQQANLAVIVKALAMGKGRIVQRIWYSMNGQNVKHHKMLLKRQAKDEREWSEFLVRHRRRTARENAVRAQP